MSRPIEKPAPRRIVIRGVSWLGDAVMSTPALLRLREARRNDFIALLTPEKLADVWQRFPAIDQVLTFASTQSAFSVARRLRAERFDTGLVLPNSFRSAFDFWWARVPERIGYAGQMRSLLLTRALPPRAGAVRMLKRSRRQILRLSGSPERIQNPKSKIQNPFPAEHHIHQYLHLSESLGANAAARAPELFVDEEEVAAFLARHQLERNPKRPLFGLNPGAEYGPAKRWPAERFIAAAQQIQERTGCRWLIFGGQSDLELAKGIAAGIEARVSAAAAKGSPSVINLAGATTLRELCAALKACDVLVTNDTGPMHLAAAVGTPVVVPFGSTSPELTGPGLPGNSVHYVLRANVPCSPCFRRVCPIDFRCMRQIAVEEMVTATLATARP